MNVPIKDRDSEVEKLRLALNMSGVQIEYTTVELVKNIFEEYKELGEDFSIKDSVRIETAWETKWSEYFKTKKSK